MTDDPYEQAARQRRAPNLQRFVDGLAEAAGIEPDFMAASEHPWHCRCQKCLDWWRRLGPDGDDPYEPGAWGPFTYEEIRASE